MGPWGHHGHWRRRWSAGYEDDSGGGPWRGGRHGRGSHSERGWGRRFFEHGALRVIALALIAEKPRNGYEIIKAVGEKTGGVYEPSPGVIYPALTLLEESGQIRAIELDGKKVFEITEEGRATLDANRRVLDAFEERLGGASDMGRGDRTHRREIRRTVGRLIAALRGRLARGVTEADIAVVVAAIDAAAEAVEKA